MSIEEKIEQEQDIQDILLLQVKAYADVIVALSFLVEYAATIGEIQAIFAKWQENNSTDKESEESSSEEDSDEDEESSEELGAEYYISLNADLTAIGASSLALFGQTILTNIAGERYSRYLEHFNNRKVSAVKSANEEIYIAAFLEEAAFLLELIGAQKIYGIKKAYPFVDTD